MQKDTVMIISVINEKGGSGKTTIATNLAFKFAKEKIDLILIDADPQRSIETLIDFRINNGLELPFNSMSKIGDSLAKEAKSLECKYDSIIIDTGGRDSKEMRQALIISDVVIIPTLASGYDQAVLNKMLELVDECSLINNKLKALILINRASPNPFLEKKINDLKEYLNEKQISNNIKIANTIIYEREIYKNVVFDGKGVVEIQDNKAKNEIDALYTELFNFCNEIS